MTRRQSILAALLAPFALKAVAKEASLKKAIPAGYTDEEIRRLKAKILHEAGVMMQRDVERGNALMIEQIRRNASKWRFSYAPNWDTTIWIDGPQKHHD